MVGSLEAVGLAVLRGVDSPFFPGGFAVWRLVVVLPSKRLGHED
jgi:hypothetical protein